MTTFRKMNKRAVTLILAYSVIVSLLILVGTIIQKTITESNVARRNRVYIETFYLAEAGIAQAAFDLAYREANHLSVPANFTSSANTTVSANASFTYSWTDLSGTDQVFTDSLGITYFLRQYLISATATHNQFATTVTANQRIIRRKIYTFQHAVFYIDDLEILPGVNMNFSGKIHGNGDIYLGTHATLTVNSNYLYSAGSIFNKRKDTTDAMNGTVQIRKKDTADYPTMREGGVTYDSDNPNWTDISQTRWGGAVKSSVHGVTSLTAPVVGSIQTNSYYAQNANLKIINTTVYGADGNPITFETDNPVSVSTFFDRRENKNITVTNIDIAKLNTSGYFPANGLLYATRTDASSSQPNAIRLQNAAELNQGLSIVSNDPIYIQGNYNNVNKKPSAIICDTLNILSNNWNDSTPVNDRVASNTEVNAAFISGINKTTTGHYNGGLENYPRFLENWSSKTLTIRGSFVQLWNNQIATGEWYYGMPYYTAPNRNWDYDTSFNNSANLPPFTPFAVETEKVVWWKS